MREIRPSGSEGGGTEANRFSLPLSVIGPLRGPVRHAAIRRNNLGNDKGDALGYYISPLRG